MHEHTILGIHSENRMEQSAQVQKILTEYGCSTFNRVPFGNTYGLRLNGKTNGIIRNCKAFFNSNGIHFGMQQNSVIEDSTVYANGSPAPVSGGNLVVWGSCHGNTVRRCRSFFAAS